MIGYRGVFAILMRFADYLLPPMLIGFILGQLFEENFGRAIRNATGQFIWERPITLALVIATLAFIIVPLNQDWLSRRHFSKKN